MRLASLLLKNPLLFLMLFVPLLYSVIAHEISHGFVAYMFGDDTAKRSGRLSLNPLIHIDPLGLLMLFLVGFGWAKPVPVNYSKMSGSRAAIATVALAGCVANILIAATALSILKAGLLKGNYMFTSVLMIVVRINIILGAFNLIPIPPLDGSRFLLAVLPVEGQRMLIKLEPYGFPIVAILLFTGVLYPIINAIQSLIVSFIGIFI